MGAPYDNIPGVDSSNLFHPDIRQALRESPEFAAEITDERLPDRLQSNAITVTDWNSATSNGWYKSSVGLNAPIVGGTKWFIGWVEAHISITNNYYITQTVHQFTGDTSADTQLWRRTCEGDVWGDWYKLQWSQAEQDARYKFPITELTTEDLNNLVTSGDFSQQQNAEATAGTNYPANVAGFLQVRAFGSFVYQTYLTYQPDARFFWRAKYTTTWSAWKGGLSNVDNTSDINKPVSTAQKALFVPRWMPSTAYAYGDQVLNPYEEIVDSKSARTSGATYNAAEAANWRGFDQMMSFGNAGFAWAGNSAWDAGVLAPDTSAGASSQVSPGANFASAGSLSGSIKFLEPGLYDVIWDNYVSGDVGWGGYRIVSSGTWPGPIDTPNGVFGVGIRMAGQYYWETKTTATGIRVPQANLEVRLIGAQQNAATNTPRVRVIKRASI